MGILQLIVIQGRPCKNDHRKRKDKRWEKVPQCLSCLFRSDSKTGMCCRRSQLQTLIALLVVFIYVARPDLCRLVMDTDCVLAKFATRRRWL